jgi:L-fucose isomerase-like protein
MERLRAKLLAFPNADVNTFSKGKKRLQKLFHHEKVEYVDTSPDILVFLSGGSERSALQSVREYGFHLLLASASDNSWAAATEVKAWMNQNSVSSLLLDYNSKEANGMIESLYAVKNGLERLKGQRFGLIGEPSEWLVNSNIDPFVIKTKLGIEQIDIPWSKVDLNTTKTVAPEYLAFFKGANPKKLVETGLVYEGLSEVIQKYELRALTVECFSLVTSKKTTACLALSKLSMDGIPAGCEGDTCSMLGLMLVKELFGVIPWIANVAHVGDNTVLFSHCTIPANLLADFEIDTHFESGKGLAIKGKIKTKFVTILRLDHTLTKLFVGVGRVKEVPYQNLACRTQLTVEVSEDVKRYFVNYPLGNHHLIIPGDFRVGLDLAARMLRMERVI